MLMCPWSPTGMPTLVPSRATSLPSGGAAIGTSPATTRSPKRERRYGLPSAFSLFLERTPEQLAVTIRPASPVGPLSNPMDRRKRARFPRKAHYHQLAMGRASRTLPTPCNVVRIKARVSQNSVRAIVIFFADRTEIYATEPPTGPAGVTYHVPGRARPILPIAMPRSRLHRSNRPALGSSA